MGHAGPMLLNELHHRPIGESLSPSERTDRHAGEIDRQLYELVRSEIFTTELSVESHLVHDSDRTAIGSLRITRFTHRQDLVIDELKIDLNAHQDFPKNLGETLSECRRGCERHEHREEGDLIDEEGNLGFPEYCCGVPVTQGGRRLRYWIDDGSLHSVEKLLRGVDRKHQASVCPITALELLLSALLTFATFWVSPRERHPF